MDPTSGNNQDPISLHKYLYSDADPVNENDPTGHFGFIDTILAIGGSLAYEGSLALSFAGIDALVFDQVIAPEEEEQVGLITLENAIDSNAPNANAQIEQATEEVTTALPSEASTIQFGNNANQIYHAFRYTNAAGLDQVAVENAIRANLETAASQIVPGQPFNQTIQVAGQNITYTAYELQNGVINVGRITVP
jgi:hypothetical protein